LEHLFIPALNLCYFCWFHPLDGLLEHLGNTIIVQVVLAALEQLQLAEVLPPITLETFVCEDCLLVGVYEL
jgi:hypothetical protein